MKKYFLNKHDVILLGLLVLGTFLLFYNAGHYFLWGDEGVTAFYGKNVLRFGLPYGFDGRNLLEFSNGIYLNRVFLPLIDPWLQYYVSAVSMAIFGQDSFGARALCIVIGLFAVFIQYCFANAYFKDRRLAVINAILMLTSVIYILYSRQSRYYSIGMLICPLVAYLYTRFENQRWQILAASFVFVAFFMSNSLIGMAALVAMSVSFFIFDDYGKALSFFLKPLPLLVLIVSLFLLWLYGSGMPANPHFLKNINPLDFIRIFWLYLKDYNATQLLPAGIFIILVAMWVKQGAFASLGDLSKIKKELSVVFIIIIFTLIISILSPQVSQAAHSDIRYATPIFPLLFLVQAFVINRVYLWKKYAALIMLIVLIGTNIFTMTIPFRSYFAEFVYENIYPFDNSVKASVQYLEKRVKENDIILVSPNHMLGSMEFYLGDKALFCNVIGEDNKSILEAGVHLPRYVYSSDIRPDWIVFFGLSVDLPHTVRHLRKIDLREYKTHVLPIYGPDVSRPELFWRAFRPVTGYAPSQALIILERIKQKK